MSGSRVSAALRRMVRERAGGCCEYCQTPEDFALVPHQIDHIISEKHGGQTVAANLALSCTLCNQHKGSDVAAIDPATGEPVALYHPRCDSWSDHFRPQTASIVALTPQGRATVRLLQLNRPERLAERALLITTGRFPPEVGAR